MDADATTDDGDGIFSGGYQNNCWHRSKPSLHFEKRTFESVLIKLNGINSNMRRFLLVVVVVVVKSQASLSIFEKLPDSIEFLSLSLSLARFDEKREERRGDEM